MKKGLYFIFFIFIFCSTSGQNVPKDIAAEKRKIEAIKKDTFPATIEVLSSIINSTYSEYKGTLFQDSTFYFSALHSKNGSDNQELFDPFWSTKIYSAQLTIGGYSTPKPLPKEINNKKYYTSNFTFNEDRSEMYFTRCQKNPDLELYCKIWKSKYRKGVWEKAERLPEHINVPFYNTSFPHLFEGKDFKALYFASNRPNGEGGMDLWYSIISDGEYQEPINLGKQINTDGNEISPYYSKDEKRLYFSSDTWLGLGGYDVFSNEGALSQWATTKNIGVPINSEYNDFYFVINSFNKNGYFSSNRPNRLHRGFEQCCNDLFAFYYIEDKDIEPQDTIVAETVDIAIYLPLSLYFANDEPNPRTTATTTTINYKSTLSQYITIKEKYISEYANLEKEGMSERRKAMELFFQDSVIQGYHQLEQFTKDILLLLRSGKQIEIEICGFASALHQSEYNIALSKRRISSVVNYFKEYNWGELLPHIEKGEVILVEQPFGSELASSKTKSESKEKKSGVYSLRSSLDRKVVIKATIYE